MILLFFNLPRNNKWLYEKIIGNPGEIVWDIKHMSPHDRQVKRYGYSYDIIMKLVSQIENPGNAVILLPPEKYFKSMRVNFVSPEPAVFYYYTGIKGVMPGSTDAYLATWEFAVGKDRMLIRKIQSKTYLDSMISFYKYYTD